MSDPFVSQMPAGWVPYVPIFAGLARGALTFAGGIGLMHANTVTASQAEMYVSAAMALGGLGWSAWQKIKSVRALRAAALRPAGANPPVLPA